MSDAPAERYAPGDLLGGRYALVRKLGEGGMGTVWLARNQVLEVDVALKLVLDGRVGKLGADRLLVEARAAARIGHPSIVRVLDYGTTEFEDPYLVMELLEGESLADHLAAARRLPAQRAVEILLPVASAIAAAHAKGIVHRDVKPENVMLVKGEDGQIVPKVVDFGIAKIVGGEVQRNVTGIGEVLGSPGYLSPQQARGMEIDERTDVWSFAVMLYEVLTGEAAFEGTTYAAQIVSILEHEPPPITDFGAGDAELAAIVARGMKKDLISRWPTMRAFGQAIADWAMEHGIDVDATGATIRSSWVVRERRDSIESEILQSVAPMRAARTTAPTMSAPVTPRRRHWLGAAATLAIPLLVLGISRLNHSLYDPPEATSAPAVVSAPASAPAIIDPVATAQPTIEVPAATPSASASAEAKSTKSKKAKKAISPAAAPKPATPPSAPPKPPAASGDLPLPAQPNF